MKRSFSSTLRNFALAAIGFAVVCLAVDSNALADGTIVVGSGSITTNGTTTTITQNSNKLLINWGSFSIPAGDTMIFNQPGSWAIALNRVLGIDVSKIYGNLLANGQVWIINPNGVIFGKGSQIDVGSLIATTSDMSDRNFRKGHFKFNEP